VTHARTRRRHARAVSGQVLMIFALAFALFLFGLTCLVADTAALYRWSQLVDGAAQLAAQSGADAVDPRYLYGETDPCPPPHLGLRCSVPLVDVAAQDRRGNLYAFERACIQAGDQSAQVPRTGSAGATAKTVDDVQSPEGTRCDTDGCRVYAEVTRIVDLPIPIPGFPTRLPVRGRQYAAPVVGSTSPRSSCTGAAWVPATPS
jgi:hypothetical protein